MIEALTYLQRLQGVHGAVIVRRDGEVVGTSLGKGAQQEVTASLVAAIFGAVAESLERLDLGSLSHCMFEGDHGAIHMQGAGDHVLLVIANKQANVGRIRLGLQHAATMTL